MNTATVARLIDVSGDSVRRFCGSDFYAAYLSPGATPPEGVERRFNTHDLKVLNYVSIQRGQGIPHDQIKAALAAMQKEGYATLPDVPSEWGRSDQDGLIAVNEASDQASQLAELTALQVINQTLRERFTEATDRAEKLQRDLDHLRSTQSAAESQLHSVELELEKARGEVSTLKTQVESFTFAYGMGREKPLPLAAIILVTALIVAVLVIVLLVVVRLVL